MGGRGSASMSSGSVRKRVAGAKGFGVKTKAPQGFTIDTNKHFQKIDTGMAPMDALDMAADQIVGLPHEMSVLIAPDGTMYISKGTSGSARVPYFEASGNGYMEKDHLSLHNHPIDHGRTFGGPSSASDWNTMLKYGHPETYITAVEGRYTLRVTDRLKLDKAKAFFSTETHPGYWDSKSKKSNYMKNTDKLFYGDSRYQTQDDYLKAAMHTLQKFGPRYGFEVEFKPNKGYESLYN